MTSLFIYLSTYLSVRLSIPLLPGFGVSLNRLLSREGGRALAVEGLHFEPSLDALSLWSEVISSTKILSLEGAEKRRI